MWHGRRRDSVSAQTCDHEGAVEAYLMKTPSSQQRQVQVHFWTPSQYPRFFGSAQTMPHRLIVAGDAYWRSKGLADHAAVGLQSDALAVRQRQQAIVVHDLCRTCVATPPTAPSRDARQSRVSAVCVRRRVARRRRRGTASIAIDRVHVLDPDRVDVPVVDDQHLLALLGLREGVVRRGRVWITHCAERRDCLKIGKETTHAIVRWTRVAWREGTAAPRDAEIAPSVQSRVTGSMTP